MELKHTKGPWANDDGVIMAGGVAVGEAYQTDDFMCVDEEDHVATQGECEANARLIAAAPEMLAMLLHLRDAYSVDLSSTDYSRLEELLAKVEGR